MQRSLSALVLVATFLSTACADDWPQWRGPNRNGVSQETGLLKEWPEEGPTLRWKAADIVAGYSSPVIVRGRVYVQTTHDNDEFCLALDEKTGQQIWSAPIGKVGKNTGPQYPGTRSTPTVDAALLYCLASDGTLVCLDAAGKPKWQRQLKSDFDGQPGNWAYSESVLIDGDALICTPGGSAARLAALDKATGETIWKSAVPGGDNAEYASIMLVDAIQPKEYVQFLRKGLVGVEAKTGKFLWRYDRTIDKGANILTPLVVGNTVFSAGSRSGGALVALKPDGDNVDASEVYFDRALASGIGGVVLVDGNLFGTGQAMFCANFATGKVAWQERALGAASICCADGRLYVRGHVSGDVALVEATAEGYREKGRFTQPNRSERPAWPHPVVANGGLYLRDQGGFFCYEVAAPDGKTGK